jgi:hypothetical protein
MAPSPVQKLLLLRDAFYIATHRAVSWGGVDTVPADEKPAASSEFMVLHAAGSTSGGVRSNCWRAAMTPSRDFCTGRLLRGSDPRCCRTISAAGEFRSAAHSGQTKRDAESAPRYLFASGVSECRFARPLARSRKYQLTMHCALDTFSRFGTWQLVRERRSHFPSAAFDVSSSL